MKVLLKNGANVNAYKQDGSPVINAAIQSGTVEAVKLIMAEDVHFDVDYTKCESPLSLSARQAETLFQEILESERDKWLENVRLLEQALISASESGRLESVRILLQFDHVYINNTLEKSMICAARGQKWATVAELLEYAIRQTTEGKRRDLQLEKLFYLSAASKEGRMDILYNIWDLGGHALSEDILGFSLYHACVLRKSETANWLLGACSANANATSERPSSFYEDDVVVPPDDFGTVLNAAAATGNAPLVRSLVQKGALVDSHGDYSLQLAAKGGHLDVVTALLRSGASADRVVPDSLEPGFDSGTALQAACTEDRPDRRTIVEALISHGADPNLGGGEFVHPIVAAAQLQEPEVLRLLLSDPRTEINVNGGGNSATPLINATIHMPIEVIDMLIQRGADIDAQDAAGDTALIVAARRGDEGCVEMLCRYGADVHYRSPMHGLALEVATEKHPQCAKILSAKMEETIAITRERGSYHSLTILFDVAANESGQPNSTHQRQP